MKLPQFTTHDLLVAMTLIGVGFLCISVACRNADGAFAGLGLTFIGAGVFALYPEP